MFKIFTTKKKNQIQKNNSPFRKHLNVNGQNARVRVERTRDMCSTFDSRETHGFASVCWPFSIGGDLYAITFLCIYTNSFFYIHIYPVTNGICLTFDRFFFFFGFVLSLPSLFLFLFCKVMKFCLTASRFGLLNILPQIPLLLLDFNQRQRVCKQYVNLMKYQLIQFFPSNFFSLLLFFRIEDGKICVFFQKIVIRQSYNNR